MTPEQAQDEAVRRICHARETDAEILDLGDLELKKLPEEIKGLKIRVLALGNGIPRGEDEGLRWEWESDREHLPLVNLDGLSNLTALTQLNLGGCSSLSNVDGLSNLTSLTQLDLSWCESLSNVDGLSNLTALTQLKLSWCESLSNVDGLSNLTALTQLKLSGCESLINVDVLSNLTALTQLDLSFCKSLSNLDVLSNLTALTELNLSWCVRLSGFRLLWERLQQLHSLYLHGSSFDDLPDEVCGESFGENVLEAVTSYFKDLAFGCESDAEGKAFLLGNGCTGKTQLIRHLRQEDFEPEWNSTHGIQLKQMNLPMPNGEPATCLNLWDFGGQDIYHGSHTMFLHRHALYILLWTPETENEDEYVENDIPMQNHRLSYWLDCIRAATGEKGPESDSSTVHSPVLIVQSKCDSRDQKAKMPDMHLNDFEFVEEIPHSSQTGHRHSALLELMQEAVSHLHKRRKQPLIGKGRVAVRDQLRRMQQEPEETRKRTLSKESFYQMCEETQAVSNPDALLQFLHRSGVVFYKPGLFDDRIIVDQGWALDAIYTLLNRAKTLGDLRQHGKFTRVRLEELIWRESGYSVDDQRTFLSMMESCGICFKHECLSGNEYSSNAEWEYIAPELLPEWSDSVQRKDGWVPDRSPVLSVRIIYPYLHDGILRTLLSRIGRVAKNRAVYWKYGCRFDEQGTHSTVLITTEYHQDSGFSEGSILFQAWGDSPQTVLERLLSLHKDISVGQEPTIERSYERQSPRTEQSLPADARTIVVSPRPNKDDPRPKVYLSYAWGKVDSDDELERIREETADMLCEVLPQDGMFVVRDKDWMQKGDLISDFMKQIGQAGFIIVVLSEKYLKSEYCMTELDYIYQFSKDDSDFKRRIVPIALPDAQPLLFASNAVVRFWQKRLQEYAPEAGKFALSESKYALSLRISQWPFRIPSILACIRDVLHWTVVELRANDFHEIRQLLKRRIREVKG